MNINTKIIEELIECFVELNEGNQKKALNTIKGLFIQQQIIKNSDYEENT